MRGKEGGVVEWIFRAEEPEAEMRWVGVVAREKMSVGWAISGGGGELV